MDEKPKAHAIVPTRSEDYPEWFQQVIKAADMAENSAVRGCMIIKPWGYGIWENIQQQLDTRIKATGHENAYFPLFIPLSFLEREADHVEGFAKECAVVTHHRLEQKDGKLVPAAPLEEPLVIRPTSETIIADAYSRWVESYRDLPLLINQWANVVRWEMRPRIFLRTTEFLWQEGHTVHASAEEAIAETLTMLEVYRSFMEEILALPVIIGEKSAGERFPGAVATYSLEAMMQDRKAIQAGTSHYLGQNFAKASGIKFTNREGKIEYGYTTSWGVTTRLIGSIVMCHGDDDGLRLPPRVAPKHVVIIPIIPQADQEDAVMTYAEKLAKSLREQSYHGRPLIIHIDKRDRRGGEKTWEWIKKGVPVRIEVGPKDIAAGAVTLARRDQPPKTKESMSLQALEQNLISILDAIQQGYLQSASAFQQQHIRTDIKDMAALEKFFTPVNEERPEIHGGFVRAKWCGDPTTEALLDPLKVTIRCLPRDQSETEGSCILTGRPATIDAIFAKAY